MIDLSEANFGIICSVVAMFGFVVPKLAKKLQKTDLLPRGIEKKVNFKYNNNFMADLKVKLDWQVKLDWPKFSSKNQKF